MGVQMPDGSRRYTTCTNGGPVFVYVKDGRIVRVTPIDFDDKDAPSWTIKARGRKFTPHAARDGRAARPGAEVAGLFRQAASSIR